MGCVHQIFPVNSRTYTDEEVERLLELEVRDDSKEALMFSSTYDALMNSQGLWQHSQAIYRLDRV